MLVDASDTPVCASLACLINGARPTSANACSSDSKRFREREDLGIGVYIYMDDRKLVVCVWRINFSRNKRKSVSKVQCS